MSSNDSKVISYRVRHSPGALQAVDFSTVDGKNYAFFHLKKVSEVDSFRHKLENAPFEQTLVSMTTVDGKPMLIMQGSHSAEELSAVLAKEGHHLRPVVTHHAIDAWRIRSILGAGGQTLQLASSFMRPITAENAGKSMWRRLDSSTFVFAATNLAANAINFMYNRGQQTDDPNQLRYIKQQVNRDLALHLKQGEQAPDVDDTRLDLRPKKEESKGTLAQADGFMKKHSVAVGELGLRYFGAFGMAFPAKKWGTDLLRGNMRSALNTSHWKVYTGLSSIVGKTIAQTAKIPDPYNPKPRTWFDELREKYSFLVGGFIETSSFAALAWDNFMNTGDKTGKVNAAQNGSGIISDELLSGLKKEEKSAALNSIRFNGKIHRDWLGGVGASMFTAGYIVRAWANYGERHVNMDELYAHASDTLAVVPTEKLPQLLANTSARLAEHFKGKEGASFASLYTHLASDFQRYHSLNTTPQITLVSKTETVSDADKSLPFPKVQTANAVLHSPSREHALHA